MGTLSKALGAYGGYICASAPVVDLLRNRARTLIYSTGLPPAIVAAAIAALDVIEQQPDYAALPLAKAKAFARSAWLPEPASPIVPVVLGKVETALAAARLLEDNGFLVTAIRPPTVPPGTARLRLTFTAQHPDREIERLAEIVPTRILAPPALSRSRRNERCLHHRDRHRYRQQTFVAVALIRHMRSAGHAVHAIKPDRHRLRPGRMAER
jgi:8-amino-7-oxononanoate synthase